jgi:hypothetical protein
MAARRADFLTGSLLQHTVLQDWFRPMQQAFDKVRYSDRIFPSLPMVSYALLGGPRQLLGIPTLREQVQSLFHWDVNAERLPVPRSTWSDAMGSRTRRALLRQATEYLVASAREKRFGQCQSVGEKPRGDRAAGPHRINDVYPYALILTATLSGTHVAER